MAGNERAEAVEIGLRHELVEDVDHNELSTAHSRESGNPGAQRWVPAFAGTNGNCASARKYPIVAHPCMVRPPETLIVWPVM